MQVYGSLSLVFFPLVVQYSKQCDVLFALSSMAQPFCPGTMACSFPWLHRLSLLLPSIVSTMAIVHVVRVMADPPQFLQYPKTGHGRTG